MSKQGRIGFEMEGDSTIVWYFDKVMVSPDAISRLRAERESLVERIREDSIRRLILDFRGVEFFSSAAMNQFVLLMKMVNQEGISLATRNLRRELIEVFEIARLDDFLPPESGDDDYDGPEDLGGSRTLKSGRPTPGGQGSQKNPGAEHY